MIQKNALYGAAISFLISASAHGESNVSVSSTELHAKAEYCRTCHGVNAEGFRGEVPMPRLAGQQPEYLKNQLQFFIENRRINPVMQNVAHGLSPAMVQGLSDYFQNLDPKPLGGAPSNLVAAGEKIFKEGAGDAVPACATCHGDDAKGRLLFPRLAGQLNDYIYNKLTNWEKERDTGKEMPEPAAIMLPIVQGLTPDQIKAVAAYVSSLN